MDPNKEYDHEIINKIMKLKSVPERDRQKMDSGKAAFLEEAANIAKTVSPESILRHKKWNQEKQTHLLERRKERAPMFTTLTSIILAVSLLLGGSGVTVAAAQASEPGDLLYNIKLLSENAVMDLSANPESQFEISLDLVDRRSNEIISLLSDGETVQDETLTRYRDQIEQAILLAYNLPEDQVLQSFELIQDRLNNQLQIFSQGKIEASTQSVTALTQTRDMIQEKLQTLEDGQTNMVQIKDQMRIQEQINNPEEGNSATNFGEDPQNTPYPGSGNSTNTEIPSVDDGNGQNGNSPWFTETPSLIETEVIGNNQSDTPRIITPQGNMGATTSKTETPSEDLSTENTQSPQQNGSNPETEPKQQGQNDGSGSQNGNH